VDKPTSKSGISLKNIFQRNALFHLCEHFFTLNLCIDTFFYVVQKIPQLEKDYLHYVNSKKALSENKITIVEAK